MDRAKVKREESPCGADMKAQIEAILADIDKTENASARLRVNKSH